MKVNWDAESLKTPRFSEKGIETHLDLIRNCRESGSAMICLSARKK